MSQLSLFSADLTAPRSADLGGLLAAHGQVARDEHGVRLSILLSAAWRARALLREFQVRDVDGEVLDRAAAGDEWTDAAVPVGASASAGAPMSTADVPLPLPPGSGADAAVLLRSGRTGRLDALAVEWTRGAVKSVPVALRAEAGLLRCWVLAAGRPDEAGWFLGLDPRAPDTHEPLAAALAAAGLAGSLLGVRAGGPGVRITGHRRRTRLAELVGSPPPEVPAGLFPQLDR
ncbi:hypothetical protein [Nakamurella endophytica]|uniref:hypothetical protein n=1 Tax=Nakamurella endophytica TaxID=1748367 RepID=UPI001662C8FD|nr:hypothetical protein [Nakamurella endophytica]